MPTLDVVQQCMEGVIECLDTYSGLVALTSHAEDNVVPLALLAKVRNARGGGPAVGVSYIAGTPGGGLIGEWWQHQLQFDAEAASAALANSLLHQVAQGLTSLRLSQNAVMPLDCHLLLDRTQRLGSLSTDTPDAERAGIQLTLQVKHT